MDYFLTLRFTFCNQSWQQELSVKTFFSLATRNIFLTEKNLVKKILCKKKLKKNIEQKKKKKKKNEKKKKKKKKNK